MLEDDEARPAEIVNEQGASPFFFVCEHASRTIPRLLGDLGLSAADLARHIAWDIGAEAVARHFSQALDAPLVLQRYSRLVVDCNRPPRTPAAMPEVSERTQVPGNRDIGDQERECRIAAIFEPFHDAVAGLLDRRRMSKRETILVTVHSFTPVFDGFARPWHFGAQYNRAPEFSRRINALLANDKRLCVADNQPYPVNDATHYTIPVHGEQRGIPHAMLEIRNDLIQDTDGQKEWADRLAAALAQARLDCAERGERAMEMQAPGVETGDA